MSHTMDIQLTWSNVFIAFLLVWLSGIFYAISKAWEPRRLFHRLRAQGLVASSIPP